jgi:hypothetical protein
VIVDGNVIFSKAETHRFPEPGEIERKFAAIKNLDAPRSDDAPPAGARSFVSRVLDKMRN